MKKYFFLFCLLAFNPSSLFASDCHAQMERLREQQLNRLHHLDEDFRKSAWEYRKYQETVYTPLWEAARRKNDRLSSKENRAAGEMAFERYRNFADTAQENARQTFKKIRVALDGLQSGLIYDHSCRETGDSRDKLTSDFRNCMEIFAAETGDRVARLRELFAKYYQDQEAFSEMVETHLTDTPSDHDTFEDRFRDYLFNTELKTVSGYLALSQDLFDRFEKRWPGEACCNACLKDNTAGQDPVLMQTKIDSQGAVGVAGNMVNNARLLDAFERFEKEAEKSDEKN